MPAVSARIGGRVRASDSGTTCASRYLLGLAADSGLDSPFSPIGELIAKLRDEMQRLSHGRLNILVKGDTEMMRGRTVFN